jgi:hypothetical protein
MPLQSDGAPLSLVRENAFAPGELMMSTRLVNVLELTFALDGVHQRRNG